MSRQRWKAWEIAVVEETYRHWSTARVAALLGRTSSSVYQVADRLGLRKTKEYLSGPEACRLRRHDHRGVESRFPKGHVPHNKGVRQPGYAPGRMAETQFKKGLRPQTWVPIGHERVSKDGYLERKICEQTPTQKAFRAAHILVWEEANGPLPQGHAVVFKDGDKQNITLGNLECISRRDLMLRNSSQRWGAEVFQVIQLRGAINRKIRSKQHAQEQNV